VGTIIPANQVMIVHLATGTDDPANRYFNLSSGTSDFVQSGTAYGFVIKSNGIVIDAVATNSYAWPVASGVSASDWTGNIASSSGLAGVIRTTSTDNNNATDWSVSSAVLLQTIGTYNSGYTNVPPPAFTYSWSPAAGLSDPAIANPVASPTSTQTYTVTVTATATGCSNTSNVVITVTPVTAITTAPVAQTVCAGNSATFTVAATGTGTLTYQWRKGGVNIPGATAATYSISSTVAADAANYDVVVSGTCGSATSTAVALTVNPVTVVTADPATQTVCAGTATSFSVTATGTGTLTYQWRKGGVDITGATASTYTINSPVAADAGNYDVVVTGSCGSATSAIASLTVTPVTAITTQPTNQTVCLGTPATFSVVASGTATLSYKWRKNGVTIPGEVSPSYTIPSALYSDMGNYTVIVTGPCGTETSSSVSLTVNATTVVVTDPSSQTVCAGSAASFTVVADGHNLTYQWRKNGVNIPGATSVTYTIASPVAADAGNYDVVLNGTCGTATSAAAALTVNPVTTITTAPVATTVCDGNAASFSVTATGTGTITYQWRKNSTNIPGATGSTLNFASVTPGDAASYDVVVSSNCGSATSTAVALTVNPLTTITTAPTAQSVCAGSSASFTVAGAGTGTITYQWRKNSVNIPGATSATYTIATTVAADAANYDVIVTGGCSSITSTPVSLTVNPVTTITTAPVAQTACAGSAATFTVTGAGTGTLTYQWRKGGVNIAGATSSTYTIASTVAADAGNYDVVVTGSCGNATSTPVSLTVNPVTGISTQPAPQTTCVGSSASFSVVAAGTGPFTYQWRKTGVNIAGATAATFTIPAATAGDAANYDVVVTGSCGSAISNAVSLTVLAATIINTAPTSQTVCAGSPVSFAVSATGAGTLTYQWRKNSTNITGATAATYTISAAVVADAGNYDVIVTSNCGSTTTTPVSLTVNPATVITVNPVSQGACIGGNASFNVTATGTGTLTYQWRKGTVNIAGATASTYTITGVTATSAGNYDVLVTSNCGTATSTAVPLTINPATTITTQPVAQTRCIGGNATFTVAATGSGTLSYQWRKGGTNITGATAATYTITGLVAGDAANYDVIVTGNCGSVTSTAVALTVNPATVITTQPVAQTICALNQAQFTVAATGTGGLTYQWRKNGVNIAGATNTTYTIASAATGDAGNYDVVITSSCGTLTSTAVALTVNACTAIPVVDEDITSATLMPNILNQNTTLRVVARRAMKVDWTITDAKGRIVMQFAQSVTSGQNDIRIQAGNLAGGTYFLSGTTRNGKLKTIRFVRL
jgi:hypothetical protein